jgi:putative ABC transport system permease protein
VLVIREGVWTAALGLSLGLTVAAALGRWMASLLWGVSAYDALAYVATAGVVLGGCLMACYAPARRAASLDPVETLRAE